MYCGNVISDFLSIKICEQVRTNATRVNNIIIREAECPAIESCYKSRNAQDWINI